MRIHESIERFVAWLERRVKEERGAVFSVKAGRVAEEAGIPLPHAARILHHLYRAGVVEKFNRNTYIFSRYTTTEVIIKGVKEWLKEKAKAEAKAA